MWLLDTTSYRLEWVHDREAVEQGYAILSHTWDKEEVSFQDIRNLDTARQLRGFRKIELTCKQAIKYKLSWAWVDTCRIDKKSSAELSEAINSMYKYYAKSTCCYVFLSDVDVGVEMDADGDLDVDTQSFLLAGADAAAAWLAESRWFTRGWTLQELIAPACVKFFSQEWEYVDTRATLATSLAAITGIDLLMLCQETFLADYTIAQRMSWAAGRRTTREEDRAYSLLGLFGVNMPLLYGEEARAFERLQREVMKDTDDHSIFLWQKRSDDRDRDGARYFAHPDILAVSPDNFDFARRTEFLEHYGERPFDFTKSGLRITIPVVRHESALHAVFNCRYSNDFRGPLAVRLHYSRSWVAGKDEDEYPPYEVERRIEVIPMELLISVKPTKCLLVKTPADSGHRQRVVAPSSFSRIWLHGRESLSKHFVLDSVYPKANWNAESSVMQWTLEADFPDRCYWGYISWGMQGDQDYQMFTSLLLLVCIRERVPRYCIYVSRTGHRLSEGDFRSWYSSVAHPAEVMTLYDVDEPIVEGSGRLSITAGLHELFGNQVCVVNVSEQAPASARQITGIEMYYAAQYKAAKSRNPSKKKKKKRWGRESRFKRDPGELPGWELGKQNVYLHPGSEKSFDSSLRTVSSWTLKRLSWRLYRQAVA